MTLYPFAGLPADGTLYYNGVTFDGALSITATQEQVLDNAGLGVRYNEITIRVKAIVSADNTQSGDSTATTDDAMEFLRSRLCKSGGHLVFTGKGFGTRLEVNSPQGGMRDVNFGPKPQLLSWSPVGNHHACEIEWAVKVQIPHCYYTMIPTTGIMAFNYGLTWNIDQQGMTTRTITGSYEIAMTFTPGERAREKRQLPDTADAYWTLVAKQFTIPAAFRRTVSRSLSENKKVMQFTIVDTEIQSNNPYPEGVTDIKASHRVSWSRGDALRARNQINATITLRPQLNGFWAWAIFTQLVRQRMTWAIDHAKNNFVILDSLSLDEDIFGFTHNFSASYRFLASVEDLIGDSGLWQPIGTDWSRWSYRLSKCTDTTGWAGLQHTNAQEYAYDLCGGVLSRVGDQGQRPNLWTMPPGRNWLGNYRPPPERSWQQYDVVVMPERQRSVARQQILQEPDEEQGQQSDGPFQYERRQQASGGGGTPPPAGQSLTFNRPTASNSPPVGNPYANGTDDVIHRAGIAAYGFRYMGKAERVGWEIPRQHLAVIGGQPTSEVASKFSTRVIGNYLGVPVYQAMWVIDYVLPNAPLYVDAWSTGQVPNLAADFS